MKTNELIGPALDWAAAKAEGSLAPLGNVFPIGRQLFIGVGGDLGEPGQWVQYSPSTDWSQGGPIIEREQLNLVVRRNCASEDVWGKWSSCIGYGREFYYGPIPLIAAMRCYVASHLGETVDVPEELK